jgi:serine/threonine-protein kinase
MSASNVSGDSFGEAIDLACDRFEAEWQAGARPQIEPYLAEVPEQARAGLARELLKVDIYYRRERGDTILPEDYKSPYLEYASLIDTLLNHAMLPELTTRLTHAGRYRLEERIGSGGMGDVYRAHDPDFRRPLAVKILKDEFKDRPDLVARFLEEAQITGQLQHPGVPPVHELGRLPDGRPFLAMRLVEGRTLADLLAERKAPSDGLPRFLTIFEQVCQTVAYAHSRRVIHRDLKPANVMVGAFGEVQVMDWGLAKVRIRAISAPDSSEKPYVGTLSTPSVETVFEATQRGAVLGTLAYMPPEQARGEVELVDERSDVFSIGATLCEILTGKPAYCEPTQQKRWQQAKTADLADTFALLDICGRDAELISLARKCLAPLMALRPRDAGAVSNAVTAYQAEVQERLRKAELERAAAEARAQEERRTAAAERRARHRTAWLAATSLLLIVVGGSGAWWYQHEQAVRDATRLAKQADTERDVTAALIRVETFLQEGWKQTDFPERWRVTVGLAQTAMQSAEGLLVAGEPTAELRERVQTMRAAVDAVERDSILRAELDRIRLEMAAVKGGTFDFARGVEEYTASLREYGIDETKLDEASKLVGSSRLREALIAAVEDWAISTRNDSQRRDLFELLRAVDPAPDAFRARWRTALDSGDGATLRSISQEKQVQELPPTTLVHLAHDLKHVGEMEAAVGVLRTGQARFPNDFWLNHDLGMALDSMKPPQVDEAVPYLMAALALRSDSPGVNVNLGKALFDKKDFERAIRCFQTAIDLDPKYAMAHHNLGAAMAAKGDLEAAISCFQNAIELDSRLRLAHRNLGYALQLKKDFKGAIRQYRATIDLDLTDPAPYNDLGIVLHWTSDLGEAIRCYRTAIDLDSSCAIYHANLGNALNDAKDPDGAIRCFQTAIALDSKDARFYVGMGSALHAKKDLTGAIWHYKTAIGLDSNNAVAHDGLGVAFSARDDLDGAIRCFTNAIALDPNYALAHVHLSQIFIARGDMEGAIPHLRIAIDVDPELAQAHAELGTALRALGRFEEASKATQRAQQLLRHETRASAQSPSGPPKISDSGTRNVPSNKEAKPLAIKPIRTCKTAPVTRLTCIACSPDGKLALCGCWDKSLRLLDIEKGEEVRRLDGHGDIIWAVAFSSDGHRALSGSQDRTVRLWDVDTCKELHRLEGHLETISSVAFLPDQHYGLSACWDKTVSVWDLKAGKEAYRRVIGAPILSVALTREGKHALLASNDGRIRYWNLQAKKETRSFSGPKGMVEGAALTADGRQAIVAGSDALVHIYDLETGKELNRLKGHEKKIDCVTISPDGSRVLSCGEDRTLRLWDLATGTELCRGSCADKVRWAAFSPDGRRAVSVCYDGSLAVWQLPP